MPIDLAVGIHDVWAPPVAHECQRRGGGTSRRPLSLSVRSASIAASSGLLALD
jgi:hypothetical protein